MAFRKKVKRKPAAKLQQQNALVSIKRHRGYTKNKDFVAYCSWFR